MELHSSEGHQPRVLPLCCSKPSEGLSHARGQELVLLALHHLHGNQFLYTEKTSSPPPVSISFCFPLHMKMLTDFPDH